MTSLQEKARLISRFKKERHLKSMSEDDFRDLVVRPLFLGRGLLDGRDYCGPLEKGKDTVFISEDKLGMEDVYAVQTKKGNLNLSGKQKENVVFAATQLETALKTEIPFTKMRQKRLPSKVFLCSSGKINENARHHILDQVRSPHIVFMDSDEIIPLIDNHMPEFWFGLDSAVMPYIRALKRSIETDTQLFTRGELIAAGLPPVATSDQLFVSLRVFRYVMKTRRQKGTVEQYPDIEEFPVTSLLSRKETLILLLGGAGGGKSTALLRMTYLLAEQSTNREAAPRVPVFLRAQEIDESGADLLDVCASKAQAISNSKAAPFTSEDLRVGNLVILIDGLDEISDLGNQSTVVHAILEFHRKYPLCKIIVTSRIYSFIDEIPELASFQRFDLNPLSYKDAGKILERLKKKDSLAVDEAKEFLRRLQDVHGLELNPLLVTVFAASNEHSRRDIPANITELFKKFTEMMLGRWDATKGLSLQYQAPLKDFVLTQIAYEIHRRKETKILISEFKHLVAIELGTRGHKADVDVITEELLHRSGLFRIIDDKIEFRHLMLQEFFAGRGLPSADTVETLICTDWWRRALVFYFGEHPGESSTFDLVLTKVASRTLPEIYQGAVTIGLALQASYLMHLSKKIPIVSWIIENLAMAHVEYHEMVEEKSPRPLREFLSYYLYARDAVAINIIKDCREQLLKELAARPLEKADKDTRLFWIITGLIETGALSEAEEIIDEYNPADKRLSLALHLGAFLVHHLKVTTPQERETALRICERVASDLLDLKKQLLQEVKSELLELRGNKIVSIALPAPDVIPPPS